jgi:hypothetical protein
VSGIDDYLELEFTCIDAGLDPVRDAVREWAVEKYAGTYEERVGPVDRSAVRAAGPGSTAQAGSRLMLFRSVLCRNWTTVVGSGEEGGMALGERLGAQLRCRVVQFGVWGSPTEGGYSLRTIDRGEQTSIVTSRVDGSGRWRFSQRGGLPVGRAPPDARRGGIRRCSREYVLVLARDLGFPVDDDRYWTSDEPATYLGGWAPPSIGPDLGERSRY